MNLNNYANFTIKANSVLGNNLICNEYSVDCIFNQFSKFYNRQVVNRLIFRGIKNASFKLFTSSQLAYNCNTEDFSYSKYIEETLKKARESNLNNQAYKSHKDNFEKNDIAFLSLMQHFRHKTPLLDFSFNPFKSLYFACYENINYNHEQINSFDIQNFFSIYFIFPDWLKEKKNILSINELMSNDFMLNKVYQIENHHLINNNRNIQAQEGLFLINTSSSDDLISVLQKNNSIKDKYFSCYNFHNSMAKYVHSRLTEMNITHKTLFPNNNIK